VASNHERLSALDAAFLQVEDATAHMHVGGVLLFDGDPPSYDDLALMIGGRLHRLPRYRQRLAWPPGGLLRPSWVDDPRFDLAFHVRHAALPHPHGEPELSALAGRLFAQPLDRARPLWEVHLVDGVRGGRFALIAKIHHALADGVSGVDIAALLLDVDAHTGADELGDRRAVRWAAPPPPSPAELVAGGTLEQAREGIKALRTLAGGALRRPAETALAVAKAARDATDLVEARLDGAPPTPYNAPIGADRRYVWTRAPLDAVRAVKDRAGATVNDVVLAGVTGALRRHLLRAGEDVEGLVLKAMVPVSTRADDERGALGNRISSVYAPLPVGIADPRERLAAVMTGMAETKGSGQSAGAEAVVAAGDLAPPQVMGLVARQMASPRLFNLTVTNIPGPPVPLYLLGRRLTDVFPLVPLVREHGLGIAVMSYDGALDFGLLACADLVPDLGDLADDLHASLVELPGWTQARRFARAAPAGAPSPAPVT
jgi:WS/DGAT/MGAT family acyltransferase